MSKSNRGFASMAPHRRVEISRAGGRAAHRAGNARTWTVEESRNAGRVGGRQTQLRRKERLTLENGGQDMSPAEGTADDRD